jgi:hypothetical protein
LFAPSVSLTRKGAAGAARMPPPPRRRGGRRRTIGALLLCACALLALRTLLLAPRAAGGTLRPRRVATLRTDAARAATLLLPTSEGDAPATYVFVANAHGASALFPLPADDAAAVYEHVISPAQEVDTACASGAASFSVGAHTSFVGVANGCGAEATFFSLQQPAPGALRSRSGAMLHAAAGTAGVRVQGGVSVAALLLPAEGPGSAPEDARTLVAVGEAGRSSVSVFEAAPAPAGLLLLVPLQTLTLPYAPPRRTRRGAHAGARVTTCTAHPPPPSGDEPAAEPLHLLLVASPVGPSAAFAWDSREHAFGLMQSFDTAARAVACFATARGDTALLWAAADDANTALSSSSSSPLFRLEWRTSTFVHVADVATHGARDVAHLRARDTDILAVAEHGAGDAACAAGEAAEQGAWWWQRWRRRRVQHPGRVRLLSLQPDSFVTQEEVTLPARCAAALRAYTAHDGRAMLLVLSDAAAADASADRTTTTAAHSALWALE